MIFDSFEFLIFLPFALFLNAILGGVYRRVSLVVLSYIFYGWATPWHCLLLVASTFLDFNVGKRLYSAKTARSRKRWLGASLLGNLGLLAVFKYAGFAVSSANYALAHSGFEYAFHVPEILLPIGISFYTFQTLSYTIDIYRNKLKPESSFVTFALYVSFFPQLVAGPIERATHLLPQLRRKISVPLKAQLGGLNRILWGLTKKIVFADWLAVFVNDIFARPDLGGTALFFIAMNAFAFQIYLDFSAYSDIAIGIGNLLGVTIRENFKWPYLSRNISEFWHRWHISLSTWLRDYLYFPLGGSRVSKLVTLRNLIIVMFLGGLWHGASLNFIAWGLIIGIALVIHTISKPLLAKICVLPSWACTIFSVLATYSTMLFAWIFFRSETIEQAIQGVQLLLVDWDIATPQKQPDSMVVVAIVLSISVIAHIARGSGLIRPSINDISPARQTLFCVSCICIIGLFHAPEGNVFLYFQF